MADVLVYTGEKIPRSLEHAYDIEDPSELLPPGVDFDTCDRESLLDWVTVENGRMLVNGQHEYRALLLPPDERMSLAVAAKPASFFLLAK